MSACVDSATQNQTATTQCTATTTAISEIQGSRFSSSLEGTEHTIRGVVTHVDAGTGFYVESPEVAPPRQSRAIFVPISESPAPARPGQQVQIQGRVEETGSGRDTMTALASAKNITVCDEAVDLPLTQATLPIKTSDRESLEGMRLTFPQELEFADIYSLQQGKAGLSAGGALWSPTEVIDPGKQAGNLARQNSWRTLFVKFPESWHSPVPTGTSLEDITGVLGHDGRYPLFMLESTPDLVVPGPSSLQPAPAGSLRVVNSNLQNFFNGDGIGGGFPTERGARSLLEFEEQSARLKAALAILSPDLLAVQELENDGFGPNSAAADLLDLLQRSGAGEFDVIAPHDGRIGSDVISVGLFYRKGSLQPVGPAHTLNGSEFDRLSRQPLAQLFRIPASGELLLVSVNHLKSKGGCPKDGENMNQKDGQGCWNAARVAAVQALTTWLKTLASEAGTENILVLGDMNALRREDPVRAFRGSGYSELVEHVTGLPQYSYIYRGQAGTLDYAFASPALTAIASQAQIWHINADWPRNMALPESWLRMSDHDPVVVDFSFNQAETSD